MKVKMKLPWSTTRTQFSPNKIIKYAPTFEVESYYDNGMSARNDFIPDKVRMGPDLYRFMRDMKAYAASKGEDLTWKGEVAPRPNLGNSNTYRYAYYGYGPKHISDQWRGDDPFNIGIIGYGPTKEPQSDFGAQANGVPNYQFSELMEAPSKASLNKSDILTNILNYSHDFSPLFGPKYSYRDPDYDWEHPDPNHPPRPTDNWVPRIDPKTGSIALNAEGKVIFMPVPLTQDLPIYNFNHPLWQEDPEAAWNLIDENNPLSQYEFTKWGTADKYADYDGAVKMNKSKYAPRPKPIDYYLTNMKLAQRGGYFEDWPEAKKAKEELARYKAMNKQQRANEEIANQIEAFQESLTPEQRQAMKDATYKRVMLKDGGEVSGVTSSGDMKRQYKSFVNLLLKHDDYANIRENNSITPADKAAIVDMCLNNLSKYNAIGDAKQKGVTILKDYIASRGNDAQEKPQE